MAINGLVSDDIPQDVLETADDVCSQIAEFGAPAQIAVARAIMAEREACAQVAARAYFSGRPFPITTGEVAAAIRNRGAAA